MDLEDRASLISDVIWTRLSKVFLPGRKPHCSGMIRFSFWMMYKRRSLIILSKILWIVLVREMGR